MLTSSRKKKITNEKMVVKQGRKEKNTCCEGQISSHIHPTPAHTLFIPTSTTDTSISIPNPTGKLTHAYRSSKIPPASLWYKNIWYCTTDQMKNFIMRHSEKSQRKSSAGVYSLCGEGIGVS